MRKVLYLLAITALAIPGLILAADEKVLKVDDFDGDGPKVGFKWETSCDDKGLGSKVSEFEVLKGGSPKSPKGHALFKGHIGKQKDPWPWVNLGIYVDKNSPIDLSGYQALRFQVKGDGKKYRVILPRNAIEDYCDYEFKFEAPKEWTLITCPLDKFTQPDWGKKVAKDFKDVYGIKFIADGDDEDFELHLDDIEFGGAK